MRDIPLELGGKPFRRTEVAYPAQSLVERELDIFAVYVAVEVQDEGLDRRLFVPESGFCADIGAAEEDFASYGDFGGVHPGCGRKTAAVKGDVGGGEPESAASAVGVRYSAEHEIGLGKQSVRARDVPCRKRLFDRR